MQFKFVETLKGLFQKKDKPKKEEKKEEDYKADEMVHEAFETLKKYLLKDNKEFLIHALTEILTIHTEGNYCKTVCGGIFAEALSTKNAGIEYEYNGAIRKAIWDLGKLITGNKKVIINDEYTRLNNIDFIDQACNTFVDEYNNLMGEIAPDA